MQYFCWVWPDDGDKVSLRPHRAYVLHPAIQGVPWRPQEGEAQQCHSSRYVIGVFCGAEGAFVTMWLGSELFVEWERKVCVWGVPWSELWRGGEGGRERDRGKGEGVADPEINRERYMERGTQCYKHQRKGERFCPAVCQSLLKLKELIVCNPAGFILLKYP